MGAIGQRGRGLADYWNVDPNEIDVQMGTFTKSFGAVGGYVAGKRTLVDYVRIYGHSDSYCEALPIPICQQIISSIDVINSQDGQKRIQQLHLNSIYYRNELKKLGFLVYGNSDSPVIPILLCNPAKIHAFSKLCYDRNIAVVVVGFPATPIITARARICMSSALTREQLDYSLKCFSEIGDILMLKMCK